MEHAEKRISQRRVRKVLDGLDKASATLEEAREICDELGEVAEEERHDCSMAMGIIEEVGALIEPLVKTSAEPEVNDPESPVESGSARSREGTEDG